MSGPARMSVQDYRVSIGVGGQTAVSPIASLQALGRLKQGERNKTEARYETHLEQRKRIGEVAWYCFEGVKLRLADGTFLTVDFPLMLSTGEMQMHDAKGAPHLWTEDSKVKMKVAAEMYPFPFFVCFPRRDKNGGGWDLKRV